MLAHCAGLDDFDRLANKRLDQHVPRLLTRNAAGEQIEQRRLVEIADRGAMAAFDVVGEDFELGLGVDRGASRRAADCGSAYAHRPFAHPGAP